MLAVKVVFVAGAGVDGGLGVELAAADAGGQRDAAVAVGLVVLDLVRVQGAPGGGVGGGEARDERALPEGVELVVVVAGEGRRLVWGSWERGGREWGVSYGDGGNGV